MGHWYSPALFTHWAKHWINCSVWKEKQSITPGLRAGGLASIGRAAAKHRSPIICDSPQCGEPVCVCAICLPSTPPPQTQSGLHLYIRPHAEKTRAGEESATRNAGLDPRALNARRATALWSPSGAKTTATHDASAKISKKAETKRVVAAAAGCYCSVLVPGQVDECPSTEWTARPDQTQTRQMARAISPNLEPGTLRASPELAIRTNCSAAVKGRTDMKGRRGQTDHRG